MTTTWVSDQPPPPMGKVTPRGWLRVLRRVLPAAGALLLGLGVLVLVRLLERPLAGQRRPISPLAVVLTCRAVLACFGIRRTRRGQPMCGRGALVANHVSWLDILVLNANAPVFFVSKAEVATWPGVGLLARLAGTLFIRRDKREADIQRAAFELRLHAHQRLLFFPEGTSTDGHRVLGFKPTLFAAFFTDSLRADMQIQPVTLAYHAPRGEDARFYGWWGDMDFGAHMLHVLSAPAQGRVEVIFHPAQPVDAFPNRKTLARAMEQTVREGLAVLPDAQRGQARISAD